MSIVESTVVTLSTYAQQLLDLAADAVASTPAGPIERQYLFPGSTPSVAFDCSTIAVNAITLGTEVTTPFTPPNAAGHKQVYGQLSLVGFAVVLVRDCMPIFGATGLDAAGATELTAAATILMEDVWAVWNAIYNAAEAGEIFGGACSTLYMDNAVALESRGGMSGYVIQIRASIDGYPGV